MICPKIKNIFFKISKLILLNLSLAFVFCSVSLHTSNARTTFKGGIIIQNKSLHTKEPRERKDLEYDLSQFNDDHLNKVVKFSLNQLH